MSGQDYYFDISISAPSSDRNHLVAKVYQRIHGWLTQHGEGDIGIGFPEYQQEHEGSEPPGPGSVIRLVGPEPRLETLRSDPGIAFFQEVGAAHFSRVRTCPESGIRFRFFRRRDYEKRSPTARKKDEAAFLKHIEKRGWEPDQKLINYRKKQGEPQDEPPYLNLQSRTTGRTFRLYVGRQVSDGQEDGGFNNYGLSRKDTGPAIPMV